VRPLHGGFALDIFSRGTSRNGSVLSPSASAAADRGLNCGRERRASRRDRESDGPQADDSFLTNVVQKLGADFQPALRDRLGETFLDSLYQLVQLLTLFTARY